MTRPQPAPLSRTSPQPSVPRRLRWNSASRLVITAAVDVISDARRDGAARHCIACRPQCPSVRLESTNRIYAAPRTTMRSCLRQKSGRQRSTRRNAHLASSTPRYVSEKKAKSCPPQVLARPASANKKTPYIVRYTGFEFGAGNETRTRDLNLGKVALYQLSYSRVEQNCTACYFVAPVLSSLPTHETTHAMWRPGPELNRRTRICSPLHNHSTTRPKHQTQGILP